MGVLQERAQREQHAAAPHEADALAHRERHDQRQVVHQRAVRQQARPRLGYVERVACTPTRACVLLRLTRTAAWLLRRTNSLYGGPDAEQGE